MSDWSILTVAIEREADVVAVRQRARRLAELLGFATQDQTRIATAVSEIARNAVSYAGRGRAEFALSGDAGPQRLVVRVSDKGSGIEDLAAVLAGRFRSRTGLGLGIIGARRLMDRFDIVSDKDRGTTVTLDKHLPKGQARILRPALIEVARRLAGEAPADPLVELRAQNQELLRSLDELKSQQDEAARLNEELDRTNKGVVALYAELDRKAVELESLNATLEQRVATTIQEREQAEESLRQAQKMEAVGQLTGGIAHDFNNLLAGIVGSLDLMQTRMRQGRTGDIDRYVTAAMTSAQRAAALTHRLLAFSRRAPLDPKPVDANQLVSGMEDLLRRTLGPAIALEMVLAGGLWRTLCDPVQLESALLNLSINARDAMPDGGKLSIETANSHLDDAYAAAERDVTPGQYVAVCVSDSGEGIPSEVIARVFDPFFTTKPIGQGTGLGLSMVYGFAKQSEGHIRIYSEPGQGTTVRLYLPRYRGIAADEPVDALVFETPRAEAGETVLVVEDEPVVRDLVVEVLQDLGYRALEASDGPSGLKLLLSRRRIDLLVTDVGLPGMNGRQLADQARERRPDLKVLFITGYAENAMLANGVLEPGMAMITKPFAVDALAQKIRQMIGPAPQA